MGRAKAPGEPGPRTWCGRRAGLACCGAAWLPWAPHLAALCLHGRRDSVPGLVSLHLLRNAGPHQRRRWGESRFSEQGAYGPPELVLSERHRAAYLREGYLVIRGLVPPETVEALREELLRTLDAPFPYEANAWYMSDAFMDFVAFGPFGRVAAWLFGGGKAHLLYSWHHLRGARFRPRVAAYHYDRIECQAGYPPAHDVLRSHVKFQVGLYDGMPGMWFLNQSAMEALIARFMNETALADFRAGLLPDMFDELARMLPQEEVDRLSLKPQLALGDAIVHSPCLWHRSADSTAGLPTGFVAPSYASPEARYVGKDSNGVLGHCDSGVDPSTDPAEAPRVRDVPRPECYPQVYPLEAARNRTGAFQMSYCNRFRAVQMYALSQASAWVRALAGPYPPAAAPLVLTGVPPSNELLLPGAGATRVGAGAGGGGAGGRPGGAAARLDL